MAITTVPIRARIELGTKVVVETPYVLSFNVNKRRNSISNFSASVKIHSTLLDSMDDNTIVIYAGPRDNIRKIFTGYVLSTRPSPCWDDPAYVVLNLNGSDVLYKLNDVKYTRRQTTRKHKWAMITGVQRKAPKGSQFKIVNTEVLIATDGDIKTDDQRNDKQLSISDLSKFGMTVSKGPGIPVDIETTIVPGPAGEGEGEAP